MVRKKIYNSKEVKKIVLSYKDLLKKEGIQFDRIYLFGSYAKNCPRDWSDIDIAVVSKEFRGNLFDKQLLLDKIADKVSYAIEPHPLHPRDLKDKWSSLALEIREHNKVL
jgi:uncharacterized protein